MEGGNEGMVVPSWMLSPSEMLLGLWEHQGVGRLQDRLPAGSEVWREGFSWDSCVTPTQSLFLFFL